MNQFLRLFLLALLLSIPLGVWAEGSKQLTPNTSATSTYGLNDSRNTRSGWLEHDGNLNLATVGNVTNSFLKPSTYNYNGVVFSEDHRLYIRVKANESLYYGVHRIVNVNNTGSQRDLTLTLRYGTGAGTQVQSTILTRNTASTHQSLLNSPQMGVIADAAQNQFGPSVVAGDGGYPAIIYQNTTGADQDFYIEFTQDTESTLPEIDRFSTYDFWDFTVRSTNTSAGVERPGRLYSKQWAFSAGANDGVLSSTLSMFPLIPSSAAPNRYFVKKFYLGGVNPQNFFRFVANSRGTKVGADFAASRRSQTTAQDYPEYNTFVNNPDPAIWPSATDPTFAVNKIIPFCSGPSGGLAFTTTASEAGQLLITLDLDGVAGYQANGRDVLLEKSVPAGKSTVGWNGLDGLDAAVAPNTIINLTFKSSVAPVNFPVVDTENSANGFTISSVRPSTTFNFLFWDDSNLDATRFPAANTRTEFNGVNSSSGVHRWGTAAGTTNATTNAGDQYTVNTYSYVTINTTSQVYTYNYTCDKDADGVADNNDIDKDNDGVTDSNESNGVNPTALASLGAPIYLDVNYVDPTYGAFRDANNDGINDIFDLDLDGIPNFLDIEADNDGIPDAIEANGGVAPTGYDASLSRFPSTDVGTNGLPNVVEATADNGVSGLADPNTDGVGRPDLLDIDADNDGIVDNIEAQLTSAYRAPTGTDTDGDGLDDRYDLTPGGTVTAGTAVPLPNTDGTADTLPDYQDTNSDNDGRSDAVEGWDTNNDGVAEKVASGVDADGDGLDDAFDTNTTRINPTNGQTPQSFPDLNTPGGDRDWRQNTVPIANNIVNSPAMPNTNAATAIAALSGSDPDGPADGSNLTYTIVAIPTGAQGTLSYLDGTTAGSGSRITAVAGATVPLANINSLQFDPLNSFVGNATFTYKVTESAATGGQSSPTATYTIPVAATITIAGTVFEDVNYGGGVGRSRATSGGVGVAGARLELFDPATSNFLSSVTTDASGNYLFTAASGTTALAANTTYIVRAVSNSILSSRAGGSTSTGLVPVQTFRTDASTATTVDVTDHVGGEQPGKVDYTSRTSGSTLPSPSPTSNSEVQSLTSVLTPASGPRTGIDFGFNFNTIVNNRNSGQGSLRQFILNSNALGGESSLAQSGFRVTANSTRVALPAGKETSIFMVPSGTAVPGLRAGVPSDLTSGVAVITVTATALPVMAITGANSTNTIIDGSTQTANVGNTAPGTVANTTTTTVGIDGLAVTVLNVPEVEISSSSTISTMLDVEAANTAVRGLAIHGGSTQTVLVGDVNPATGYLLENIIVGVTAAGIVPTATNAISGGHGLLVRLQAGVGTVQTSFFAYTGLSGVDINNGTGTTGITQILGNQFLQNGYTAAGGDGISLGDTGGNGPALVQGNLITTPNASGVQIEIGATAATQILNNTIKGAGTGGAPTSLSSIEGAGISYLQRDGTKRGSQADVISKNVITNSQAAGIVIGYGQQNVTISQNSLAGNGGLGIDLIDNAQYYTTSTDAAGSANYGNGDGITRNDGNDPATTATTFPNRGVDFPVIVSATVQGTNLVVQGYSRPGAVIEFFNPGTTVDASNFGEGQTYLGTYTEGSAADGNTGTAGYSPANVSGTNQGTDAAANRFTFTIPLTGAFAGYNNGSVLTSTATLNTSTSEFSRNFTVGSAPLPVELTAFTVAAKAQDVVLSWATASEKNNDHFAVERSLDGTSFTQVATVQGHGTTANAQTYSLVDQAAGRFGQMLYYRLRQVDMDETESFSPVRTVTFGPAAATAKLSFYPNPAAAQTTLDLRTLPAGTYSATLLDLAGRTISTRQVTGGLLQTLDLSTLPNGSYVVLLRGQNVSQALRLVKRN